MPPLTRVVSELHRLAQPADSDAELLERFVRRRDQPAFTALVERHGPMVLRLCRRVLGDAHAAEDALQATFLVLARRAATLPRPAGLASWLYAVAQRVAFKARRAELRSRRRPINTEPAGPSSDPLSALTARELLVVLEEELQRLPAAHRMAVVTCCLEGHSRDEAAELLGCSVGALRGSLERGRARLHARLLKRGITLTAVLAAAEAARGIANAAMLAGVTTAALGTASAAVVRLAKGAAFLRLPIALVMALLLGGATVWLCWTEAPAADAPQPGEPAPRAAAQPAQPARAAADGKGDPLPPEAVARIGSPRLRHAGQVNTITYTPDGKSIVSFDEDGHLCFWDAATGEIQRRLRPSKHAQDAKCALTPDGKRVVVFDGHLGQVIDVETSKALRSFRQLPEGFALYPSFDPAVKVLAIHASNVLRVVDIESGRERFRTPVDAQLIGDCAVSPDGKTVAASVVNGSTILFFDAASGKLERRLDGPDRCANIVAFSADGRYLFSGQSTYVLWDLTTGKVVGQIKGDLNFRCAVFAPDGKRIALGFIEGVLIAQVPSGKVIRRLPAPFAMSMSFSTDGRTLLVGGRGGEISQWDVTTGRLREASASPFPQVHQLQFLDERRLRLFARTFEIWDWRAGKALDRLPEFDAEPDAADVSRHGRWLAYPSGKGKITIVDGERREAPRHLKGPARQFLTVRFAADGRTLFATAWDNIVCGWDIPTGELRHEWKDHTSTPNRLVVSPDGRWVVTATTAYYRKPDTVFRIWDVKANRLAHKISQEGFYFVAFAFSSDGRQLAAGGGSSGEIGVYDPNTPGRVVVFDTASGRPLTTITGHPRPVAHVAFSPDGRSVAAADYNFQKKVALRYWEVATRQERHRFEGHVGAVHALAFSPSGAHLAAASPDAPAFVWEVYGRHSTPAPASKPWSAEERDRVWQALGSGDAAVGYGALRQLIRAPSPALALVRERLNPADPVDPQRVERWLADLDDGDFTIRQTAFDSLEKHGDRIEVMLAQALTSKRGLEAKRRIESLLAKSTAPTADNLGRGRALEALEQIATPEAVRLLEALAAGAPSARLTREAAAARDRLKPLARR